MRLTYKETDERRHDDRYKTCVKLQFTGRFVSVGHEAVGVGHGVVEETDADDRVEVSVEFNVEGLWCWFKCLVHAFII